MTTLRGLPDDRYVLVHLDDGTLAAVPHDDPLAPLARRWLDSKQRLGDEAVLRAWLARHQRFRIERMAMPCAQLTLWPAA